MELVIGIIVVVLIIRLVFYDKKSKNSENVMIEATGNQNVFILKDNSNNIEITLDIITKDFIENENQLVEIKEKDTIAKINQMIPTLFKMGKAVNSMKNAEDLFRVIIPKGANLMGSDKIRGIYTYGNGIAGHVELKKVVSKNMMKAKEGLSVAMAIGSMVVGQYYMDQINNKLEMISDDISKIQNFQNNEYRSKVASLVVHIKEISDFKAEILENNELRISKINQLNNLEQLCTQLLEQALNTVASSCSKNNSNFHEYEAEVKYVHTWYLYQNSLFEVLNKISDLKYTLNFGKVSKAQCSNLYRFYKDRVSSSCSKLAQWHFESHERLQIHINEGRRRKEFIDAAVTFIPSLFDDNFNYFELNYNLVEMIKNQSEDNINIQYLDTTELYNEDVQIIVKEDKLYYLPQYDANEYIRS